MSFYYRNLDVLSYNEDLETIFTIPNFPVYMGAIDHDPENDIFLDMNFQISKSTGMVQINPLPSLSLVYLESHNPGIVGNSWKNHHAELSSFVLKNGKNKVS